jgi:hypothetical protein
MSERGTHSQALTGKRLSAVMTGPNASTKAKHDPDLVGQTNEYEICIEGIQTTVLI